MVIIGEPIRDYPALIGHLRGRAEDMQLSRAEMNHLARLHDGYSEKLLAANPIRRLGFVSMKPVLRVLGSYLVLVEDPELTARTLAMRTPADALQQRFQIRPATSEYANV